MLITLSSSAAYSIYAATNSITFTNELAQNLQIVNQNSWSGEKKIGKVLALSLEPWPKTTTILTLDLVQAQFFGHKDYRNIVSLVGCEATNYSKPPVVLKPGTYDKITVKLSTLNGSILDETSIHVQLSVDE